MSQNKDNIRAGLFVLSGFVLALVVVFLLADIQQYFEKLQSVKVRFTLMDGLQGLKDGATVTLGDVPVGTVTLIEPELKTIDGDPTVIAQIVTFTMPEKYKLNEDAILELKAPFVGSGTSLNIRSVGNGEPYIENEVLEGGLAPSQLAKQFVEELGLRETQKQQIRDIIANVESLSATLAKDVPVMSEDLKLILEDAKPLARNARQATEDAKIAVADVKELVAEFKNRSGPWLDRIDSITENTDSAVARVDQLLEDKDPAIRNSLDNVEAITQRAREETMDQIKAALEKADGALANARDATEDLKTFVTAQKPVLARAFANFQLTGAQLKLAAIEVRRSPWRLLYSPSDQELEHDNLYDAARSFSLAAGTLDAAAASLKQVVDEEPENYEEIRKRIEYLESLFGRFESVEQRFWDALDEKPGNKASGPAADVEP